MPEATVKTPTRTDPESLRATLHQITQNFDRFYVGVVITVGDETANVRSFTLQVVDRLDRDVKQRFVLMVVVGTDATGTPGGTQLVTSAGPVIPIVANQAAFVVTDEDGEAVISVEVSGAGSRYMSVIAGTEIFASGEVTWA